MKKLLFTTCALLTLMWGTGVASATLVKIGTVTYSSGKDCGTTSKYNNDQYDLIWDDDNNGNSVVWIDFTNFSGPMGSYEENHESHAYLTSWAHDLEGSLQYNLYDGYQVSWDDNQWRLPNAAPNGFAETGYNVTSSELGHLFYSELGNVSEYGTGVGNIQNTGPFQNLMSGWYQYSTLMSEEECYIFSTGLYYSGGQGGWYTKHYMSDYGEYGIAVRSCDIVSSSPIPEPASVLLIAIGMTGIGCLQRRKKDTSGL